MKGIEERAPEEVLPLRLPDSSVHYEGERQKTPLARAATWFAGTSKNENVEPYLKKWLTLSRWWQQSMKPIHGLPQNRERGWCDWACQTNGVVPVKGYFRVGVCKWVWILCAVEHSPKISAPSSPPESHMRSCIWQRFTEHYCWTCIRCLGSMHACWVASVVSNSLWPCGL